MKVTVVIDLSETESQQLLQNSIERVLNNAINIGSYVQNNVKSDGYAEDGSTLWQDCEELKPLTTKIWGAMQEAVRLGYNRRI